MFLQILYVVAIAASFLLAPKRRKVREVDSSMRYRWDRMETEIKENAPIPVIYGENITSGNVLNRLTRVVPGYDRTLNLYAGPTFKTLCTAPWPSWQSVTMSNVLGIGIRAVVVDSQSIKYNQRIPNPPLATITVTLSIRYKRSGESDWKETIEKSLNCRIMSNAQTFLLFPTANLVIDKFVDGTDFDLNDWVFEFKATKISLSANYSFLPGGQITWRICPFQLVANIAKDREALTLLLGLGEGPIQDVTEIKINDSDLANFKDKVFLTCYKGTPLQSLPINLNDIRNTYTIGQKLPYDAWKSYTTKAAVYKLKFNFFYPLGLFAIIYNKRVSGIRRHVSSHTVPSEVFYRIEYKAKTSATWLLFKEVVVSRDIQAPFYVSEETPRLTPQVYDFRIKRLDPIGTDVNPPESTRGTRDDTYVYDVVNFESYEEVSSPSTQRYANTALLNFDIFATDQLSGSVPNFQCRIKGLKIRTQPFLFYLPALPSPFPPLPDPPPPAPPWPPIPPTPGFTPEQEFTTAWNSYESAYLSYSNNPAWCIVDLLTNPRYGLGKYITSDYIDFSSIQSAASYYDLKVKDADGKQSPRYELNIVIDGNDSILSVLEKILAACQSYFVFSNNKLKLLPERSASISFAFTEDNIIKDTFQYEYVDSNSRYNTVDVEFLDRDLNYTSQTVRVQTTAASNGTETVHVNSASLEGVTSVQQAIRIATHLLKSAQQVTMTCAFKTSLMGIKLDPGDVISITHTLPQWAAKKFRIASINIDSDGTAQISCFEYATELFEADRIGQETYNSTISGGKSESIARSLEAQAVSNVETGQDVNQNLQKTQIGNPVTSNTAHRFKRLKHLRLFEFNKVQSPPATEMLVSWATPEIDSACTTPEKYRVYTSKDFGKSWILTAETKENSCAVTNVSIDSGYYVKIAAVSKLGAEQIDDECIKDYIFITGKYQLTPPLPPSKVEGGVIGKHLNLHWYPASGPPVTGYKAVFGSRDPNVSTSVNKSTIAANFEELSSSQIIERNSAGMALSPKISGDNLSPEAFKSDIILFGGCAGQTAASYTYFNDTWIYSNNKWSQCSPANSPYGRFSFSLVYNSIENYTLLFGGYGHYDNMNPPTYLNETWMWNGRDWLKLSPFFAPGARSDHTMAFDSKNNKIILFGGNSGNTETWEWNNTDWTQIIPGTTPAARLGATMAYDAKREQIIMFGGRLTGNSVSNETWAWSGSNWTQILPGTIPTARSHHSIVYDSKREKIIMWGGLAGNVGGLYLPVDDQKVWEWDGSNWSSITVAGTSPSVRGRCNMVYDPYSHNSLIFGGFSYNAPEWSLNDSWLYISATVIPTDTGKLLVSGDIDDISQPIQSPGTHLYSIYTFDWRGQKSLSAATVSIDASGIPRCFLYEKPISPFFDGSFSGATVRASGFYNNSDLQVCTLSPVTPGITYPTVAGGSYSTIIDVGRVLNDAEVSVVCGISTPEKPQWNSANAIWGAILTWSTLSESAVHIDVQTSLEGVIYSEAKNLYSGEELTFRFLKFIFNFSTDNPYLPPELYFAKLYIDIPQETELIFDDHFVGYQVNPQWVSQGTAGFTAGTVSAAKGNLLCQTPGATNAYVQLFFNDVGCSSLEILPTIFFELDFSSVDKALVKFGLGDTNIGSVSVPNNGLWFEIKRNFAGLTTSWFAYSTVGATISDIDTTISTIYGLHTFKIEAVDLYTAKFYMDGKLVAIHSDDLPLLFKPMQPFFLLASGDATSKSVEIDRIRIWRLKNEQTIYS